MTEQIDALDSMGANPIHYRVVPRFLACMFLIPSLTIMAVACRIGDHIVATARRGDLH